MKGSSVRVTCYSEAEVRREKKRLERDGYTVSIKDDENGNFVVTAKKVTRTSIEMR
jgi:hypothetical protein